MKRCLAAVLLLIILLMGTATWLHLENHAGRDPEAAAPASSSSGSGTGTSGADSPLPRKSKLRPLQPDRLEDLLPEGAEVIAARRGRFNASGGVTLRLPDGSTYSGDDLLLAAGGRSLLLTGDLKVDTPKTDIELKRGHMELVLAPDSESGIRSVGMKGYDMEMRDKKNGSQVKAGEVSYGRRLDPP